MAPKPRNGEGAVLARLVHDFCWAYVPTHLTSSAHTIRSYRTTLALYVRWLQSVGTTPETLSASDFSQARLESWLSWLATERGNGPRTCNVRLAHMRSFLKYASDHEPTMCHLAAEGRSVGWRKAPKAKVEGMSVEAVHALAAAPDQSTPYGRRDLAIIVFLYSTGCRVGEMLGCRLSQLDLDGASPHASIVGKGGKPRVLYLPKLAVEHLRAYVAEFHGDGADQERYLFWSRNHAPGTSPLSPDAVTKALRKHALVAHEACAAVPIDITPHRLRHARATHWLNKGMPLPQVSLMLGHANVQTTMEYLDITVDDKAEAMQSMAGVDEPKKWKDSGATTLLDMCGLPG